MAFSLPVFIFVFFPVTFVEYYLIQDRFKNIWLLVASIFFYAWGEPKYVILILLSTLVNYYLGLVIDNQNASLRRKVALTVSILFNIGILVYFKYSTFFAEIVQSLIGLELEGTFLVSRSPMPIGISFFTFQILSYQIDVYRRNVPAQKCLYKLALYIMLFPQMIAGPIVRYSDIAEEIEHRNISLALAYSGLKRFMLGFSKKIIISNAMGAVADYAYSNIGLSSALSWLGALCYMLQIYYDFSGYSDMAIGMGRMAGFHFQENFEHPYAASSVQDFWRRWHISLSSWFRDYVYIPLGGNRKGKIRTYLNLLVVFFITGLWHGASYNFIVWGMYHGLFLCLERIGGKDVLKKLPKPFVHLYTLFVVLIGWVFFRADTLGDAAAVIRIMFSPSRWNWPAILPVVNKENVFFLVVSVLLMCGIPQRVIDTVQRRAVILEDICILIAFTIGLLYMVGSDFNPFIYFRF